MARAVFIVFLLLLLSIQGSSHLLDDDDHSSTDNLHIRNATPPGISLYSSSSSSSSSSSCKKETCKMTYGFLPCVTTFSGNIVLALVYSYFMFHGAGFLSMGTELLMEILGPGIVGGVFLPILRSLPDAAFVLVSGLCGSKEIAQKQVLIGMGLLSGSTVLVLTIVWGTCIVAGNYDLSDNSKSIDTQDTRRSSLTGSGVTTDLQTSHAAKIMVISVIPFMIVQIPQFFNLKSERRHLPVLTAIIIAIVFLLCYCFYQVHWPWIQKRRLAYAKHKHVISGILRFMHQHALGRLVKPNGRPNKRVIEKLFTRIDLDNNGLLSPRELTALIIGIEFEETDLHTDDAVQKLMDEFDTNGDKHINKSEFVRGISRWILEAEHHVPNATLSSRFHHFYERTKEEHNGLIDGRDEVLESIDNRSQMYRKAILQLLVGTAISAALADPLVDVVSNFSNATSIPSFFVSFITVPFATKSGEAVSAIMSIRKKKQRTTSLALSEIYGMVTMGNILNVAVFLTLVYVRQLTWDFSAEVLVVFIVCIVIGLIASFRTTLALWTCLVAYILYPLSVLLIWLLDYVFEWQ